MADGACFVFGDTGRYTPAGAALLNGALAHSLDFDDTHAAGTLHPGAPVIPAAIAPGRWRARRAPTCWPPSWPATR